MAERALALGTIFSTTMSELSIAPLMPGLFDMRNSKFKALCGAIIMAISFGALVASSFLCRIHKDVSYSLLDRNISVTSCQSFMISNGSLLSWMPALFIISASIIIFITILRGTLTQSQVIMTLIGLTAGAGFVLVVTTAVEFCVYFEFLFPYARTIGREHFLQ